MKNFISQSSKFLVIGAIALLIALGCAANIAQAQAPTVQAGVSVTPAPVITTEAPSVSATVTAKLPYGVDDVLKRYQQRAAAAGTDPLGFWSPFSYAEMQILEQAVSAVGNIDQGKLADYLHKTPFKTVIGERHPQPK